MVKKPKKKGGFFLHLIPYIVTIASAIAAVTPHESNDRLVQTIKLVSDILALNVGHSLHEPSVDVLECKREEHE